jgi:polyhydroxybutyrate depolymerase
LLLLTHCGGGQSAAPMTGPAGSSARPSCPALVSEPPPPLLECSAVAGGSAPIVDDFDDGNLLLRPDEQRVGAWYSFTDETPGCAELRVEAGDSSPALHFSGGGFSAWGAGFGVSLAWSIAEAGLCIYDLSAYSGIRFRARGNAPLRMNVPSRASAFRSSGGDCPDSEGCFDQHGRNLGLPTEFREFEIPFCSLTQRGFGAPLGALDLTQVTNLNFLVQSRGDFDVWLDDLELIPRQPGDTGDCSAVCPADELTLGVVPRPGETSIDQEATGVRLYTFDQPTANCGPVRRRYLSYIPRSLPPATDAPVLIVLHGLGADAESMREFITIRRFETLAERDGFIVVYGNAAPGAATVAERPNGGGFRKNTGRQDHVDDFAYLSQIIADLASRGAIGGKNPIFLTGLSDGGGLAHVAVLQDPTRYHGVAALMPYPGPTVAMPPANGGFALRRVLVGYSIQDPRMPAGYSELLAPLGPAWAAALGLGSGAQTSTFPDLVTEGADYDGTSPIALLTRDSHAEEDDYGESVAGAQVKVVRFDHAGHLWPVPNPPDREQEIAEFGLRNRDLDMSDVVWEFFRSSL